MHNSSLALLDVLVSGCLIVIFRSDEVPNIILMINYSLIEVLMTVLKPDTFNLGFMMISKSFQKEFQEVSVKNSR